MRTWEAFAPITAPVWTSGPSLPTQSPAPTEKITPITFMQQQTQSHVFKGICRLGHSPPRAWWCDVVVLERGEGTEEGGGAEEKQSRDRQEGAKRGLSRGRGSGSWEGAGLSTLQISARTVRNCRMFVPLR